MVGRVIKWRSRFGRAFVLLAFVGWFIAWDWLGKLAFAKGLGWVAGGMDIPLGGVGEHQMHQEGFFRLCAVSPHQITC